MSDARTGNEIAVLTQRDAPGDSACAPPGWPAGRDDVRRGASLEGENRRRGDRTSQSQGRIRAATRTADGKRVVTLGDDRVF